MAQSPAVVHTGAHRLLAALEARGIRYLFGVPGHGAYPIYNAICDFPGLMPVVGRHEQSSLFSALGYAWAGGTVAVATSVPEAGLTNASTGLLEATWSQDRLLFVIEENPIHRDVLRAVVRYYRRVASSDDLAPALTELMDRLEYERPGAAALEIPNRVLAAPAVAAALPTRGAPPAPPAGLIAEAARALATGGRCIILAGATAAAARVGPSLLALAEKLQAPVLVDGLAKGVVPEDHPLALARAWSPSGPAAHLVDSADLLLVVGAPVSGGQGGAAWEPRMVAGGRPREELAQRAILIDWDDQDHRALPARLRLYGHVPSIVDALNQAVAPRGPAAGFPAEQLAAARDWLWDYAAERVPWAAPFFRGVRAALPRDAILLLDSLVGLWLDRLFPAYVPLTVRFPFGTGTLGFGAPAAVGAKLARPEREVVVVAGDGAFLYNPQELATMLRYGQKLTIVVANDSGYGAIKHNMQENFGRATAHELANPDFVRLGEAFGMRALRLASPDDIGAALAEALAGDRSTLIDVPLELRPPRRFYT